MAAGRWKSTGGERVKLLRQQIALARRLETRVGWMESARYVDGKPVAGIAVVQEYGSEKKKIPSRSFMRSTQAEQKAKWDRYMYQGFSAVMAGRRGTRELFEAIGQIAAGDVRKKITLIYSPPLATSTLKARARRAGPGAKIISIKPLNDSGYMLATLTSLVVEESK